MHQIVEVNRRLSCSRKRGIVPHWHITEAIQGTIGGGVDWLEYAGRITQPAILIHAPENYSEEAPILPEALARETVDTMKACKYVAIPGNHITMLYGKGAREIARVIDDF